MELIFIDSETGQGDHSSNLRRKGTLEGISTQMQRRQSK